LRSFARSISNTYQRPLDDLTKNLERYHELLKDKALLLHYEETKKRWEADDKDRKALQDELDNQRLHRVRQWLAPLDCQMILTSQLKNFVNTTGTVWLASASAYKNWQDPMNFIDIFYLFGMPGSGKPHSIALSNKIADEIWVGKTNVASRIVYQLQQAAKTQDHVVTYVYCGYEERCPKSHQSIMRTLLSQLLNYSPTKLAPLYDHALVCVGEEAARNTGVLQDTLVATLKTFDYVVIVLDGIDEMEDGERKELLNFLLKALIEANTGTPCHLKLFLSCQKLLEVVKELKGHRSCTFYEIEPHDTKVEIQDYVKERAKDVATKFSYNIQEIIDPVLHKVDCMYGGNRDLIDY